MVIIINIHLGNWLTRRAGLTGALTIVTLKQFWCKFSSLARHEPQIKKITQTNPPQYRVVVNRYAEVNPVRFQPHSLRSRLSNESIHKKLGHITFSIVRICEKVNIAL